ncbi:EAL and HDOD domain-containing protein [Marinimicrobium agarilyticum]|uniref:EAL and HDOD domain-containing protein n=1 Tax=Marinimicrobium agarilyticum TaxID=306546 RepID=UPI0003F77819|nr:HDOD domain-containing protein [Marinimicrobium agarilyticum]
MSDIRPPGTNALLASQPIYDRDNHIAGMELLYRHDSGKNAVEVGEDRATSEVLFNYCTGVTSQVDHYQQPAFINVSREFLCSGAFLPIDPRSVVVELVERIEPDAELIEAVRKWNKKGFTFALDDFEFKDSWKPLLFLASIIKVDIEQTPLSVALEKRKKLARFPLRWLAERVETAEQHQQYLDAGFDLFQGYFLARPAVLYGKKLSPSALNLARLISQLFADEPDIDQVTDLLAQDPLLSVSLIRIVNSPLYKGRHNISTMKEVVMRLGIVAIRRWAVLISSLQASSPEVARTILIRAQACAALAPLYTAEPLDSGRAFLAGLLSGADVLLQVELPAFLQELDLAGDIKSAALERTGGLGELIKVVEDLERRLAMKKDLATINRKLLKVYQESAANVQALFNELS